MFLFGGDNTKASWNAHSFIAVSAFTDYIKGLPPSTLDVELRMLQIIDDEDMQTLDQRPEVQTIGLLLDYFIHELSCKNNFEFIQAVIKLFLKVHVSWASCPVKF